MGQYDKVKWRGAYMTRRQRQALIAAEKAIAEKYRGFKFIVLQGSWRPITSYSGTSHTGAAVVDLGYAGMGYSTRAQQTKYRFVLRKLREVGRQATFGRGPWNVQADGTGYMPLHYHTIDLDTHGAASSAVWQAQQYRYGYDGLHSGTKDRFPFRPDPIRKWRFK
jgi:hypothetical protein